MRHVSRCVYGYGPRLRFPRQMLQEIDMATRYAEDQVNELLLQALKTERGGIQVYTNAIKAAQNDDLRKEWKESLDQTRRHEQVLLGVFKELGLDPEASSPG